ncbi:uncharacterized protein BJX67DRAFT_314807 [Aspergillus lucknowensis]|uniref:Uncharacterized protein n=1 Tax=Aspergillus lucknowensis TaxID=176173 RepID=A0ABR4LCN8_9EURO
MTLVVRLALRSRLSDKDEGRGDPRCFRMFPVHQSRVGARTDPDRTERPNSKNLISRNLTPVHHERTINRLKRTTSSDSKHRGSETWVLTGCRFCPHPHLAWLPVAPSNPQRLSAPGGLDFGSCFCFPAFPSSILVAASSTPVFLPFATEDKWNQDPIPEAPTRTFRLE